MNKARQLPLQSPKGETVFSQVCRYHHLAANRSVRYTLTELFGPGARYVPHFLTPGNLQTLSEAMRTMPPLDEARHIAIHHTGLPYLTFGRSAQYKETFLADMLQPGGARRVLARTGLAKHISPTVTRIPAFCGACTLDDYEKYGTPIWHVAHQLAASRICHLHGSPLLIGSLEEGPTISSRHMLALPPLMEKSRSGLLAFPADDPNCLKELRWLAAQAHWILQQPIEDDFSALPGFLRGELVRQGFHGKAGGLDLDAVESELRERLGTSFGYFFPRMTGATAANRWAFRSSVDGQPVISSERLLLITRLLFPSVDAAISAMRTVEVRVDTTAPEPVASTRSMRDESIRESFGRLGTIIAVAEELGVQFLTVRQSLERQGIAIERRRSRIQELRPTIVAELQKGVSPQVIADALDIGVGSVNDMVASDDKLKMAAIIARREKLKVEHREALEAFLKSHPSATRVDVREKLPGGSAWLRKNDLEWLEGTLPDKQFGGQKLGEPGFRIVDTKALNQDLVPVIQDAAERLRQITPPLRLSRYSLLREAKLTSRYERYKESLPSVVAKLEELEESTLCFRRRRLDWSMKKISETSKFVSLRALERISRLDRACMRSDRDWIDTQIKTHGLSWLKPEANDDPDDEML